MRNRLERLNAEPNREQRLIWGQLKRWLTITIVVLVLLVGCSGLNTDTKSIVLTRDADVFFSVLAFSPDGQTLAFASAAETEGTVRFWDVTNTGAQPTILTVFTNYEDRMAALSPDLKTLASYWVDGTIHIWDLTNPGADPVVLTGYGYPVTTATFSPDGQVLATGREDGTICLWDLSNPSAAPVTLIGHEGLVSSITFSPHGQILASISWAEQNRALGSDFDAHIRLWDLTRPSTDPTLLTLLPTHFQAHSVAFSPDGETLASGCGQTVCLWNVRTPSSDPIILSGHSNTVREVTFSPDGKTLASTSSDKTMRLWDVSDPSANPVVLKNNASLVVFSPDGRKLAFQEYGAIRLRDLDD